MRLPKQPPDSTAQMIEILQKRPKLFFDPSSEIQETLKDADNRYWNWEDTHYRASRSGLIAEDLWALIKHSRRNSRHSTLVLDTHGNPFTFRPTNTITRILHMIDLHLGGTIGSTAKVLSNIDDQQRYLATSLREEAIASSMIEGAVTTRADAKEMLQRERQPRSKSEWMILNNYNTIQYDI